MGTVFGDYQTVRWDQVLCSHEDSDAKPYMQAQPHCATAINMGNAQFHTTDQDGNPGFCSRTQPGSSGAAWSSSCWKVRCVHDIPNGSDSPLNNGIACKHQ